MARTTRPPFPTPSYEDFCQFLKDNRAYTIFRKNYKEFTGSSFSRAVFDKDFNREFPVNTFDWKKSPQGLEYWCDLDNRWYEKWFKPYYDTVIGKKPEKETSMP